jgi:hypothetical protein
MHPNELLARREIDLVTAGDFDALEAREPVVLRVV